ncbi:hypothetical protein D9M71_660750 [compost metagenome]
MSSKAKSAFVAQAHQVFSTQLDLIDIHHFETEMMQATMAALGQAQHMVITATATTQKGNLVPRAIRDFHPQHPGIEINRTIHIGGEFDQVAQAQRCHSPQLRGRCAPALTDSAVTTRGVQLRRR